MDFIYWIILIVVIVGVAWWFMKRNRSDASAGDAGGTATPSARADGALSGGSAGASAEAAGTTGIASAAGFGRPSEPAAPTTADDAAPVTTNASAERTAPSSADERRTQDQDEWETQWSETGSAADAGRATAPTTGQPATSSPAGGHELQGEAATPVHHPEYTEPHAPTLAGAETAALEEDDDDRPATAGASTATAPAGALPEDAALAETRDRTESSAVVETGADHMQDQSSAPSHEPAQEPEPAGHLAAEEPYGAGSASAGADGSGPADYPVKGDAGSMIYYAEGHPDYELARADVWFESEAHAEAAGFRAPRRTRL